MKRTIGMLMCIVGYLVAMLILIGYNYRQQKNENTRLHENEETLLAQIRQFKVSDSLSAVEVGVLRLTIDQLEKYRGEDIALINQIKGKNKELQSLAKAQTETIAKISGKVTDSIIIDRWHIDTLRCVQAHDNYIRFDGCIDRGGNFEGEIVSHDTLLISAFVEYKRFLGFLWRTSKVKNRRVTAVSRNPHTKIGGLEYYEVYY